MHLSRKVQIQVAFCHNSRKSTEMRTLFQQLAKSCSISKWGTEIAHPRQFCNSSVFNRFWEGIVNTHTKRANKKLVYCPGGHLISWKQIRIWCFKRRRDQCILLNKSWISEIRMNIRHIAVYGISLKISYSTAFVGTTPLFMIRLKRKDDICKSCTVLKVKHNDVRYLRNAKMWASLPKSILKCTKACKIYVK